MTGSAKWNERSCLVSRMHQIPSLRGLAVNGRIGRIPIQMRAATKWNERFRKTQESQVSAIVSKGRDVRDTNPAS
ncbi:unnamed protein product [Caenorhabditis nigoni]